MKYDNNAISRLEGEARIRTRPESMLGSRGIDGAKHTITEILGNALDEVMSGYGKKLIVTLDADGVISVRDFGRGVPLGWNEAEKEWNYFLIYEELYAGGKYDANQNILEEIDSNNVWGNFKMSDHPYLTSIGLNGLGAASTQYTSRFFEVKSFRNGTCSRMYYERGRHVLDELEVTPTTEPDGTYVRWKPDDEVFTDTKIPHTWLKRFCESISYVAGIEVDYVYKDRSYNFPCRTLEGRMSESTKDYVKGSKFVHLRDQDNDILICEVESVVGRGTGLETYLNCIEMHGGAHADGYSSAIWNFLSGLPETKGIRLRGEDFAGKFSAIINTRANKVSLRGQTKDYIDDDYVRQAVYDCVYNSLMEEYRKGTQWVLNIIEEVVQNAQNRVAVAEMSKKLKSIETSIKKHKVSKKFVVSESYLHNKPEETELFIVEGDSAGGKVTEARSSKFQCVLPIRGKSLNVYKSTISRLIENKEICDMIAALGCGVDLDIDGYDSFDISKLKIGKIFFLVDADVDGKHIAMLLFLIFYKLFPELLYEGRVYLIDTPLYVLNLNDGSTIYCMTDSEYEEKRQQYQGVLHSVDRFKGLGEMDTEPLWETTLNPETRSVHPIKIERGDTELVDTLEILFGKSTDRRKERILGELMGDMATLFEEQENIADYIKSLNLSDDIEYEVVEC